MVDKIWYNMEELIGGSEERVLIETYWNVNTAEQEYDEIKVPVLIETYWNVNIQKTFLLSLPFRINRNILECKFVRVHVRQARVSCINRNILECKSAIRSRVS